jgi:hypothetical protein
MGDLLLGGRLPPLKSSVGAVQAYRSGFLGVLETGFGCWAPACTPLRLEVASFSPLIWEGPLKFCDARIELGFLDLKGNHVLERPSSAHRFNVCSGVRRHDVHDLRLFSPGLRQNCKTASRLG